MIHNGELWLSCQSSRVRLTWREQLLRSQALCSATTLCRRCDRSPITALSNSRASGSFATSLVDPNRYADRACGAKQRQCETAHASPCLRCLWRSNAHQVCQHVHRAVRLNIEGLINCILALQWSGIANVQAMDSPHETSADRYTSLCKSSHLLSQPHQAAKTKQCRCFAVQVIFASSI